MATIGHDIDYAKQLLDKGELVGIPTETVYGLGGNALNAEAVARIYEVKDRPSFDPLIVHVASLERAMELVLSVSDAAQQLAEKFWPGPLTLLLQKSPMVPELVTAGLDRVAIRCPDHPITLPLLKILAFPLAAPSANPFGYVSPTTAQHVADQLGKRIPYILDGGPCKVGIESTIVGWEGSQAVIYRLGGLDVKLIESVIGEVSVLSHSTSRPQAPGQLKSHYAPRKKFLLGNIDVLIRDHGQTKTGVLAFRKPVAGIDAHLQCVLSPAGNMNEAARNLFSMMRLLDGMDVDVVLAEPVPETGVGRAINDRLRRAAAESA